MDKHSEYPCYYIRPGKGMTTVETVTQLKKAYPDVKRWTCLMAEPMGCHPSLARLLDKGPSGSVGDWQWRLEDSFYPQPMFWDGTIQGERLVSRWVGMLAVAGPGGASFRLFSCLDASGSVGRFYFTSTEDLNVLDGFLKAVHKHLRGGDHLRLTTQSPMFQLDVPREPDAPMVIDPRVLDEIERQTDSFLLRRDSFRRMRIPYRRGFLFVGLPGTGKTMMVRHLLRRCAKADVGASFWAVVPRRETDDDDVNHLFRRAADAAPAVVLMEELDSIAQHTSISRGGLLNLLDGLGTYEGILIIATTNNPELVDPALLHRPSRFDRVWKFGLPDVQLRRTFLRQAFPEGSMECLNAVAAQTDEWSYAYLNELRITASLLALDHHRPVPQDAEIEETSRTLAAQFKAGKQHHIQQNEGRTMGFRAA
jgi:hypothetical protein